MGVRIHYDNVEKFYDFSGIPYEKPPVAGGESGVPIEVVELPTPTAEDIGKVYLNTTDGNYYMGEEGLVLWADMEDIGTDKIHLNTSVDIAESMRDVPMEDGGMAMVDAFAISDGYNGRSIACNKLDLSLLGMQGYMYMVGDQNDSILYISADGLTVEQLNELLVSMDAPFSFTHLGWQLDEYVPDTSMGYTKVALNELPNGQPFAYKEKGVTFKPLDNPPILQEKTASVDGVVTADDGFDGLSKVTVNVASEAQATLDALITGTLTEIESDVESIDDHAFYNIGTLTAANFPNVTSIGENAFYYCWHLMNANFPNVTTIGDHAFYKCEELTAANFQNVTNIGQRAFAQCEKITSVDFPNVTSIKENTFELCKALTTANIPNATRIAISAFQSCEALTSANFPNATFVGRQAFYGCQKLTSVNIPNITTIDESMLYNCASLTSVNFPNATSIGKSAFCHCYNLMNANFPNATTIGNYAFSNNHSLSKLIFGISQDTVGTLSNTNGFYNCYHLTATVDETYNPTGAKDGYIYVPHSLVADYRVATNWAEYATQIMPYVATLEELANIDGTTYDKACVGEEDYAEYTYNGTSWEVYTRE